MLRLPFFLAVEEGQRGGAGAVMASCGRSNTRSLQVYAHAVEAMTLRGSSKELRSKETHLESKRGSVAGLGKDAALQQCKHAQISQQLALPPSLRRQSRITKWQGDAPEMAR